MRVNIRKRLLTTAAFIMAISVIAGCGSNNKEEGSPSPSASGSSPENSAQTDSAATTATFDKPLTLSMGTLAPTETDLSKNEFLTDLNKRFNINFDLKTFTWDNWSDKQKIFAASGDLPNIMWANMSFPEVRKLAEQGLLKALPDDLSKYPNIQKALEGSKEWNEMAINGKHYAWPRWLEENSGYFTGAIYYRKDWAKQLGLNADDVKALKPDELIALAKAFQEQDPGKNGKGKTIGYAGVGWAVPGPMATYLYNVQMENYIKGADGQYQWGARLPESVKAIKFFQKLIKEGVLWKDFFAGKNDDASKMFMSGKLGLYYDNAPIGNMGGFMTSFKNANPTLDPYDSIGLITLTNDEGKMFKKEREENWTFTLFGSKTSDEKMDRILALMDYLLSKEGTLETTYGVKGVDWDLNADGTVKVLAEKDDKGAWKKQYLNDIWMWGHIVSAGSDKRTMDLVSTDPKLKELYQKQLDLQASLPANILTNDYKLMFTSTPLKDKFGSYVEDMNAEIIKIALSSKDVEKDWNAWLASMAPKIDPILKEINEKVGK